MARIRQIEEVSGLSNNERERTGIDNLMPNQLIMRWTGDENLAKQQYGEGIRVLWNLKHIVEQTGLEQHKLNRFYPWGNIQVQTIPGYDIVEIHANPVPSIIEKQKLVDYNIYLGGWQNAFPYNWVIEKRSNSGELLFSINENGDDNQESYVQGICAYNGEIYAVGDAWDYTVNNDILWKIRKYNARGDLVWAKSKDYSGNILSAPGQGPYEVQANATGTYVLGKAYTDTYKIHLEKLDIKTGDTVWTQEFNNGLDVYFYPYSTRSLVLSDDALFISFTRVITNSPYNTEGVLQRRDLNGNLIWEQVYNPSTGRDRIESISLYGSNIYASTYKYPSLDSIIKYSTDGALVSTLNITAQALSFDGSFYTADNTTLKKCDKDGNIVGTESIVPSGYSSIDLRRMDTEEDSILLAGDKIDSTYTGFWFIQKRSKGNGSLLWESSSVQNSGCRALYVERIEEEI